MRLTGILGPRSAAALRIVLNARDGFSGLVQVDAAEAASSDKHVAFVVLEASAAARGGARWACRTSVSTLGASRSWPEHRLGCSAVADPRPTVHRVPSASIASRPFQLNHQLAGRPIRVGDLACTATLVMTMQQPRGR